MDNSNRGQEFIEKYLAGEASDEERKLVERFYLERFRESSFPENVNHAEQLKALMWERIATDAGVGMEQPVQAYSLWKKWAGIAAAIAVIAFGIWFYTAGPDINSASKLADQNEALPGKHTATLTSTNGQVINLSDAKRGVLVKGDNLKYNDNSPVEGTLNTSSADKNELLTATTPRGGTYQVTLPDGTNVWLNADSKISFASQFTGKTHRRVKLTGEAYFEVAPDKRHPFIVESKGQQVEVLGTHFNINAYDDESTVKTTLLEGSVRIHSQNNSLILKPGQQATLKDDQITALEADMELATAWHNGDFVFKGQSFRELMRSIARWYDVEVNYDGFKERHSTFSGVISRSRKLSAVLKMMEKTNSVKFRIEGKRIYVIN